MKAELRSTDTGPTLYVEYRPAEYLQAINNALAAYNLERGRVRVVAYQSDTMAKGIKS
jgi:hypothetical protein